MQKLNFRLNRSMKWLIRGLSLLMIGLSLTAFASRVSGEAYLVLSYTEAPRDYMSDLHLTYQLLGDDEQFRVEGYNYYRTKYDTYFLGFDAEGGLFFYQRQSASMSPPTCDCVYRVALNSTAAQVVTERPAPDYSFPYMLRPTISPDETTLSVVYTSESSPDSYLQFINVNTPAEQRQITLPAAPYEGVWSADSQHFYLLSLEDQTHQFTTLYRVEVATMQLEKVTTHPLKVDVGIIFQWSPQGHYLAMTIPRHMSSLGLYILDTHTSTIQEITELSESLVSWSSDEQWLYFSETKQHEMAHLAEIVRFNPVTHAQEQITTTPGYEEMQFITPDDEWLVFLRRDQEFDDRVSELWRMKPDGTQAELLLTGIYNEQMMVEQGQLFALAQQAGQLSLYRMALDGTDQQMVNRVDFEPDMLTITPDHAWIVVKGASQLLMVRPDGTEQRLVQGNFDRDFSFTRYDSLPFFHPHFETSQGSLILPGMLGLVGLVGSLVGWRRSG